MIKKAVIAWIAKGILMFGSIVYAQKEEKKPEEVTWKMRAEFSYVKTSGNSDTETMSGKLETKREEALNRYYGKANVFRAEDKYNETANKWLVDGRWERVLSERLYGFLTANYLIDRFSGYKYRIGCGPGAGYEIVKTKDHTLKGSAAVLYYRDRYSEGPEKSDDYVSGKAAINYEWQIFDNLKVKENAEYLVSFDDTHKYFINSETAVEVKIKEKISLGISYIINYQNEPPSTDIRHTDKIFLTSLIIDF
jgi:putative salt-induced outer membrane protein